jgi:transposase
VEKLIRIGMDTSKSVFQLHGVDSAEQPILRRKLRRGQVLPFFSDLPPAQVAMEACGASHYWARELQALGHEVVLIPPQSVKPYVQRGKSDAADAEVIVRRRADRSCAGTSCRSKAPNSKQRRC